MDEGQGAPPGSRGRRPRGSGIPVGRVFGIPVSLTVPWFLFAALITVGYGELVGRRYPDLATPLAYAIGLGMVGLLLVSVLLHELGHALTARRYGVAVRRVRLDLLGGHTELAGHLPRPGGELVVSLAGPAVSLLLGLACLGTWAALPGSWAGGEVVLQVALVNLVVAGYNVLPGLPLDGGRALGAVVWALSGHRDTGDQVGGWAGRLVAAATLATGVVGYVDGRLGPTGLVVFTLLAISLFGGAGQALRAARTSRRIPGLRAGSLARRVTPMPAGTPLSQLRPGSVEVGVVDSAGRLVGLVDQVVARKVPARRRPWTAVSEVAVAVPAGEPLPGDLSGAELIVRISQPDGRVDPSRVFPVALDKDEDGNDGVGVLWVADVLRAVSGPTGTRPAPTTTPAPSAVPAPPEPITDTAVPDPAATPGDRGASGEQ